MNHKSRMCCAVLSFMTFLGLPKAILAATFTVNRFDDPVPFRGVQTCDPLAITTTDSNDGKERGSCSLREAVLMAGKSKDLSNTINIPKGHYLLSRPGSWENNGMTGDLDIVRHSPVMVKYELTINGAGADRTIIDASGIPGYGALEDRIFDYPASGNQIALTINGLTIQNGSAFDGEEYGRKGEYAQGGGIRFAGSIDDAITINSCVIRANRARDGGGLFITSGKATIDNSTIGLNYAGVNGMGGGLFAMNGEALAINNSTFGRNFTDNVGGAIYLAGYKNHAMIRNSTIYENRAGLSGGGLALDNGSGVNMENSILFGNTTEGVESNCHLMPWGGEFVSNGYNILGPFAGLRPCRISGPARNDQMGDPLLTPFGNNGGPSPTYLPSSSSIAIRKGNSAGCRDGAGFPLEKDQRGKPRPLGTACDIGAVQLTPSNSGVIVSYTKESDGSDQPWIDAETEIGANSHIKVAWLSESPTEITASAPSATASASCPFGWKEIKADDPSSRCHDTLTVTGGYTCRLDDFPSNAAPGETPEGAAACLAPGSRYLWSIQDDAEGKIEICCANLQSN